MIEKQPSCDDISEPSLLPVDEAIRRLFSSLPSNEERETVPVSRSLNRVLADQLVSPVNVPPQVNSAMDGYAINASCIPEEGEVRLLVCGTSWAGKPFSGVVQAGEAVRIFTGAIMPEGSDTVVIQEHVRVIDAGIDIDSDVIAQRNVRQAGEDIEAGQLVFEKGRQLGAADVGVLASLGIHEVPVFRRLTVAFFSTGDELQALSEHVPGVELAPGMLFDSNRYTLNALLAGMHVNLIDMGIVRDNEADTRKALESAADQADVVITSGGVSAGDADFVTRAFHDLGQVSFWKLAMRPGRPLAFGRVKDAIFFGLPGNPVAVMITFLLFVQPALKRLSGMQDVMPMLIPAVCLSSLRKSAGRVEYQRGVMRLDEEGRLVVKTTGKQGAGRLSSMSAANCLIVIDADIASVSAGDSVSVLPFQGLLPG